METEEQIVGEMKTDYKRSVKGWLGFFMYKAESFYLAPSMVPSIYLCVT